MSFTTRNSGGRKRLFRSFVGDGWKTDKRKSCGTTTTDDDAHSHRAEGREGGRHGHYTYIMGKEGQLQEQISLGGLLLLHSEGRPGHKF